MINLITNELYKIFHKKAIYILYLIMLLFLVLNNILYKTTYTTDGLYLNDKDTSKEEIKALETKLKGLNQDSSEYISLLTDLDLLKLKISYPPNSFQYNTVNNYFYDIVYNLNYYKYKEPDSLKEASYQELYNKYREKFTQNDNIYFINQDLDKIKSDLEVDPQNKELLLQKEVLSLRIKNNINYSTTYLNEAVEGYYQSSQKLNNLSTPYTYEEKITFNNLKEEQQLSKYIITTKQNINKENDLRGCLKTIVEDYELFLVIIIIFISSSIISEEYSKRTIKQLLIKPYSRTQIILSKYLTCIIILLLSIIFLIISELWVGSLIFKIDSLKIPIVVYDFNLKSLREYPLYIYMFLRIFISLPKLILILTLSFALSTIFLNSIFSSLFTLSLYTMSNPLLTLLSKYSITKYLIFSNWDFLTYINGNLNKYVDVTIVNSMIVYIIHCLLLFLTIFVIFKKRDIKNI